jgi:hypothetical protein
MTTPRASAPRSFYVDTAQAPRWRMLLARVARRASACVAAQDEVAASVPEHEARLSDELGLAERHVAALRALVPLQARCQALRADDLPAAEARGAALQAEAEALGAGAAEARDNAGRADRNLVVRALSPPCCMTRVYQFIEVSLICVPVSTQQSAAEAGPAPVLPGAGGAAAAGGRRLAGGPPDGGGCGPAPACRGGRRGGGGRGRARRRGRGRRAGGPGGLARHARARQGRSCPAPRAAEVHRVPPPICLCASNTRCSLMQHAAVRPQHLQGQHGGVWHERARRPAAGTRWRRRWRRCMRRARRPPR